MANFVWSHGGKGRGMDCFARLVEVEKPEGGANLPAFLRMVVTSRNRRMAQVARFDPARQASIHKTAKKEPTTFRASSALEGNTRFRGLTD